MLGECVFSLIGLLLCSGSSQVVFCWSGGTYVNVPVVSVMLFALSALGLDCVARV